jgi:hypothetical protein
VDGLASTSGELVLGVVERPIQVDRDQFDQNLPR